MQVLADVNSLSYLLIRLELYCFTSFSQKKKKPSKKYIFNLCPPAVRLTPASCKRRHRKQ